MNSIQKLYVLVFDKTDSIYAISEFEELMANYIKLFDDYFQDGFDKNEYRIDIIRDSKTINRYLTKYQDYQLYQRGENNKLTLTEWEWNYYEPFFRELYERAKDTIINLMVLSDVYDDSYQKDHSEYTKKYNLINESLINTSNQMYIMTNNFYDFIGNISIRFIKDKVLMEPIKAHKFNRMLDDIIHQYQFNVNKEEILCENQ